MQPDLTAGGSERACRLDKTMPSNDLRFAGSASTREKQSVALRSVLAAALLTTLKTIVGLLTGSLGILSEAAHSGLDLVATAVTYLSVRVADQPADDSHPFGHGKVEHLSAFIETALLLVTCALIVMEAVRRLFFHTVHVEPTVWAFGIMLLSVVTDILRSRALSRVGREYNSQALEADALHFSTDIYGSSVVILGLLLVYAGNHWHLRWLGVADPIAALLVAGFAASISLRLGRRTVDALVDAAPKGTAERIRRAITGIAGVKAQDRIRVRQSGDQLFVDLRLTLKGNIPFEHAQSVVDSVESEVRGMYPTADVVVHAMPQEPAASDMVERIRSIAHRHNYEVHDVTAYRVNGRVNVSLDLELDPGLRLDEAHAHASDLEGDIKRGLTDVEGVNIHIEPKPQGVVTAQAAHGIAPAVERRLARIARSTPGVLDCHAVEAHQVSDSMVVSLHCTLAPDLELGRVHEITEDLKFRFRKAFPQISKVSVHAEPRA